MTLLALLACVDSSPYTQPPEITNHVEDWRDEVIYQLLVDRFANGDVNNDYNVTYDESNLSRYLGGDYQGIIDKVDYLTALGVTTLWISPVVVNVEMDAGNGSYHGYWTQDFLNVNPHWGDLPKLREMVQVMHDNDIKVVLDIVVNHVGQLFYYDINRNGQADITTYYSTDGSDTVDIVTEWDPAYDSRGVQGWTSLGESGEAPLGWVDMPEINRVLPNPPEFANPDWYNRRGRVTNWGDPEQVVYGDFPGGLKDLKTENPDVREALIDAFSYWIETANLDGFRIDTLKHVEHSFWQEFCPAIRDHAALIGKERFLMFGESFDGDDALIGSYTFDQEVDSVVYFSQKYQVYDDVFKYNQPTTRIQTLLSARATNFGTVPHDRGAGLPPTDILVNFMDNHDIPRFLFDKDSVPALKSALTYLLTQDGIPTLYYGTEQGFSGGNDPANREPLWTTGFDTDGDLFQHTAALTALRKAYAPLRRGDFTLRWVTDRVSGEEDSNILAFERSYDGESVLVVINTSDDHESHTAFEGNAMPVSYAPGTELVEVFPVGSDRTYTVSGDGTVTVDVGPRDGVVLVPAANVVGG
ncbi:MAG: alpha-amylase family glycosyl hydrolase [Pseudomonadota bacterium]|nr:alpha-amylase family glycosyl hydrolase [Pseudomonadota bacterium]